MALRKFIIERDIPAAGSLDREQLRGAAAKIEWRVARIRQTSNGSRALSRPTRPSAMIDPTTEHSP